MKNTNSQETEKSIKDNAVKVKCYGNLDTIINELYGYKIAQKNVYFEFNGHKLYSLLDDEDSCYKKVTGRTKAKYLEDEKKWLEEFNKRQAEEKAKAKKLIPSWIKQGQTLIYPQKYSSWEQCVKARANDLYNGSDLVNALDAMEIIENSGDFDAAKKVIDNAGHSGCSYGMVMNVIVNFSKKGPDFYEYMEPEVSKTQENADYLKKLRAENAKYQVEAKKAKKPNGKKAPEPGDEQ